MTGTPPPTPSDRTDGVPTSGVTTPFSPVPTIPPTASAPPPAPQVAPVNWAQVGAAIGATISVLGATYSSIKSDGANSSADQAHKAVVISQEMLDKARARAASIDAHTQSNERRIAELEKQLAVLEASQKGKGPSP